MSTKTYSISSGSFWVEVLLVDSSFTTNKKKYDLPAPDDVRSDTSLHEDRIHEEIVSSKLMNAIDGDEDEAKNRVLMILQSAEEVIARELKNMADAKRAATLF